MASVKQILEVEGKSLPVSNLDKILYPEAQFTKGQVIDYYTRVSPFILPHLQDRPVTMKRFPDGVDGKFFYQKNAPIYMPEWIPTFAVSRRSRNQKINYILLNDLPALIWSANFANLEIHPFLHQVPKTDQPTHIAFDLDPGEGTNILECARVALILRDVLKDMGLECFPKVSGSKGIQIYVPLNTNITYESTQPFAHAMAQFLEERESDLIISKMPKHLRAGKVFIDWSQNSETKTTICVYSLRAKTGIPYVSMPVEWKELSAAIKAGKKDRLYWQAADALKRIEKKKDLFQPVLNLKQKLPTEVMAYFQKSSSSKGRKRVNGKLSAYQAKRNFSRTPEPEDDKAQNKILKAGHRFVIQKHAASHLHYDFRLEMEGTLKSWAVPKGPPYKLNEKRLAMPTEDHPLGYLDFEGVIPKGQYGGGTVMVWDIGTYKVIDGHYQKGFLHITLEGKKLIGEWALLRSRKEKREVWFLSKIKKSMKPPSRKIEDSSALTNRSMEEIAAHPHVSWTSNYNSDQLEPESTLDLKALPASDLQFVDPMLAKLVDKPPNGSDWQYEVKWDGYRALVVRNKNRTIVYSRRGNILNRRFPTIANACAGLPDGCMVDGEIVAFGENGEPSFNLLQNSRGSYRKLHFYIFDLITYDSKDVRSLSFSDRRLLLERSVIPNLNEPVQLSDTFPATPEFLSAVKEQGLEGIVAKRINSSYESGQRSGAWMKYKTYHGQELVIGGYIPGNHGFDSLLIGYFDNEDKLIFITKLRNGFSPAIRRAVAAKFKGLETKTCPFANLPERRNARKGEALTAEVMRKCRWLEPKLVAQVEFTEWTPTNNLRHSSFAGLRDDKDPHTVRREREERITLPKSQ